MSPNVTLLPPSFQSAHPHNVSRVFTHRLTPHQRQFIRQDLHQPPPPVGNAEFDLNRIIGDTAVNTIAQDGVLRFQAVGDTGKGAHTAQEDVADAMAAECFAAGNNIGPAFFLHLGDVTYGPQKRDVLYRTQFYEPYANYPRKIIAVAGNHDGDSYPNTDPTPLDAFLKNFCDTAQHEFSYHNGVTHSTMNLPGVYWRMRCPLIDIVGLYSNRLENPGMIEGGQGPAGGVDTAQKDFLTQTLRNVAAERAAGPRKALVFAVHHPPFSGGGHIGSGDMLDDIDECCRLADVMPDAVLSGHSHNYQRFTRKLNFQGAVWRIPYLVAGGGGRGITRVTAQTGTTVDDHRLEQYDNGFGYLLVSVTATHLTFQYTSVDGNNTDSFDSVTVDLNTHTFV